MKKFLRLIICTVLILLMSSTSILAVTVTLKDVDVNDPASDKILWAIDQGYMKPVLGKFFPNKTVNRGEFAYIISKITGEVTTLKNPSKPSFSDTPKTYQYYKYVETMKQYINSYKGDNGTKLFKPKNNITREDAAMAIVKLLGFDSDEALIDAVESDISIEDFIIDANKISKANVKYVEIAVVNELMDFRMNDDGDIYFDPKATVTRKDLASLLWNALQQRDYLKEMYEENNSDASSNDSDDDYSYEDSDSDSNVGNDSSSNIGEDPDYPWDRNINVKFVNNPDYLGTWQAVAFVQSIDAYTPGMTQNFGLFFNKLTLLPNGYTDMSWLKWTDGHILNIGGDSSNSNLIMKEINGKKYLFYQWISGDQLYRGMKPSWYVFEKVE